MGKKIFTLILFAIIMYAIALVPASGGDMFIKVSMAFTFVFLALAYSSDIDEGLNE